MLERAATKDPDAKQAINLDGFSKDDFLYFLRFTHHRCVVPPTYLISQSHANEGNLVAS